jgi:hypothetical protein
MKTQRGRLLLLNIGTPSRLLSISPDGGDMQVLCPDLGVAPDGLAVDPVRGHIFSTYMGSSHDGEDFFVNDGAIFRVDLDGTNRMTIVPEGATFTPKQIQYDPEGDFIYWCDREGMRVMRARPSGAELTVLVQTGSTEEERRDRRRHCVGVAVDPRGGFLYWTQKGKPDGGEGRLLRAPLRTQSGVNPAARPDIETLFDNLPEPIDLEWDAESSYLYWTDRGAAPMGNTLNRCLIRAGRTGTPEIILRGLHEGIGLAIDHANRRAFVGDLGGYVRTLRLDRPDEGSVIFSGHGPLTGVAYCAA